MSVPQAILASQGVYRALLRATANPGEHVALPETGVPPHEAVLTTLLDHEVSFHVLGDHTAKAEGRLSAETGSHPAPLSEADFALVLGGGSGGGLRRLKRGTLEDPAGGSTAVYAVRELSGQGFLTLTLSGPGVPGERTLVIDGLAKDEVAEILRTRADYPTGVDVYLVSRRGTVVAIPRSTKIETIRR